MGNIVLLERKDALNVQKFITLHLSNWLHISIIIISTIYGMEILL